MEATPAVAGIHRRTHFEVTAALVARFKHRLDRRGDTECWPWLGAQRNGYGAIKHEQSILSTHVVAAVLEYGEIPDGRIVLHSCDNRLCCNPAHLRFGTPGENVREMQDRRKIRAHRGEEAPNALITEEQVRVAKAMRIVLKIGATRAAKLLNAPQNPIENAMYGNSWMHVAEPSRDEAEKIVADFLASAGLTAADARRRNRNGEGRYTGRLAKLPAEAAQ